MSSWSRPWSLFVLQRWCELHIRLALHAKGRRTRQLEPSRVGRKGSGHRDRRGPQRGEESAALSGSSCAMWAKSMSSIRSTDATPRDRSILWREGGAVSLSGWMAEEAAVGDGYIFRWPHDWVFLLDADEVLTPELTEEIRRAIQMQDDQRLLHRAADVLSWPGVCATAMPVSGSSRFFRRGKGHFECR